MKNTFKLIGIIAIVAVIGFSMAACEEETWEDSLANHTHDGQTYLDYGIRVLIWGTSTVYTNETREHFYPEQNYGYAYYNPESDNSHWSIVMQVPENEFLTKASDWLSANTPSGVTASNPDAMIVQFVTLNGYGDASDKSLIYAKSATEYGSFWYTDRNVNITGSGVKTHGVSSWNETYNLNLKKGWNFIRITTTQSGNMSAGNYEWLASGWSWYVRTSE
jgi:hypothetical protein